MQAGLLERLTPRVRRLIAPNGGPMTGAGTNSYLLGNAEITIIDPGPAIPSHVDALLRAVEGRLKRIVVTHTHPDHSPAASILSAETGAELVGCVHPNDGHQDLSFQPDWQLVDGDALHGGDDYTLEAIATPGHVGNHFCFWMPEEHILFTGDHIMAGSTVVIIPPSGDMGDYLASLQRLLDFPARRILPGHGGVIDEPEAEVRRLLAHRLRRENKVLAALRAGGESSLHDLTPAVYDDVDPSLHPIAQVSLWAHLLKLEKEGRAAKFSEQHWMFGEERWVLREE